MYDFTLSALFKALTKHKSTDPGFALTPKCINQTLCPGLWNSLVATLSTRFDKSTTIIKSLVPNSTQFVQYGRARWVEGGDSIQARELVSLGADSHDMSYVRVS